MLMPSRFARRALAAVAALVVCATASCSSSGRGAGGAPAATSSDRSNAGLSMVVIGDSIPFNSPQDCPGCTGFAVRYAAAVQKATGRKVTVQNLSQHNGLTLPMLLDELDSFRGQLADADVIVIGIAHNSIELASDSPCGGTLDANQVPDWTVMTPACAQSSADRFRTQYDRLFAKVAEWRAGRPTLMRTINRYDDWRGAHGLALTARDHAIVRTFISTWNAMLCAAAAQASFGCADVYRAFNGPRGDRPSGDLLADDYTHPSDRGNAVIADTLIALGVHPLA